MNFYRVKRVVPPRILVGFFILGIIGNAWSLSFAQVPSGQTVGGVTQQQRQKERTRQLEEKIQQEKPDRKEIEEEGLTKEEVGEKILIVEIQVEGAYLIPKETIDKVIGMYEGHELSLNEMQRVADLITDEYRKRGYVTSRAYIPPQTIREGVLVIRIVEGKLGDFEIRGNKYFSSSLLRNKINLESGGYFDYSALQKSLVYINEHPDRTARAVLVPGREPGTTDVVIEVEDSRPYHIGFEYDNFGSRFIKEDRFSWILEHNNLTGHDDKLYFKYQISQDALLDLQQLRYIYPIGQDMEIGAHFLHNDVDLKGEFEGLEASGEAYIYGLYVSKLLIQEDDLDVRWILGYDYKDIKNYLLGSESSSDELSIFKTGLDIDKTDKWGRTIFTAGLDIGVPDFMGSMKAKDDNASRAGAGGKFQKGTFNLFRLQPMPFETSLLWKNSAQFSNHSLVASEQFQIGGPYSVRGFPPAEFSGDSGVYSSLELSVPLYFVPEEKKVPLVNDSWYHTLRLVLFYDWANAYNNRALAGEEKSETLQGWGAGLRFNLTNRLTCRVETGFPIGRSASDGDHAHTWVELTWRF